MPVSLVSKMCVPCKGGTPPLPYEVANGLLKEVGEGWSLNAKGHLYKEYKLTNFVEVMGLANMVAQIAENENHHPDLMLSWGKFAVEIWTHKINGLTESDFILAAKIQQAFSQNEVTSSQMIDCYFQFVQKMDLEQMNGLFAKDAVVVSPLYGTLLTEEFYKSLFSDTSEVKIEIKTKFISPNESKICAVLFSYLWTMKDGDVSKGECVDVFEFNPEGKIFKLKIIYDSYHTRKSFQKLKAKKDSSK